MPRINPSTMRTLSRAANFAAGGATVYLAKQANDYIDLKQSLPRGLTHPSVDVTRVEPEKKEWMLYGRQSPALIRESKKHLIPKVASPSVFDALQTEMTNEKNYELFGDTPFCVQRMTSDTNASQVVLSPEKMKSTALTDLDDNADYEVGFARKQGFADITEQSPFYHSSIAVKEVTEDSPASEGALLMKGGEVKHFIQEADKDICQKQHCTLVESNCYSASVYTMGKMIETIDGREGPDIEHSQDVQKVYDVMSDAAFENFGRGITNNSKVSNFLKDDVSPIVEKHRTLLLEKDMDLAANKDLKGPDEPENNTPQL